LKDPEAQKEETSPNIASSESVSEGKGGRGAAVAREEIPRSTKSTSADQGTSLKGSWSEKKETAKKGIQTDRPL
jgi:hypothetical protein